MGSISREAVDSESGGWQAPGVPLGRRPDREAHRSGPPPRAGDESLDVWGSRDSGFVVDESGQVTFRGARCGISGTRILHPLAD